MWNLYYRNPRLLVLTVFLILVSGLSAYRLLPRMEDPQLIQRAAFVMTRYPGASAERVESLVTEKIEEKLKEIEEVKQLVSSSRAGISVVGIELKEEVVEVEEVWSRVRDKLRDVSPDLPQGAQEPEFNDTDTEIDAYTLIAGLTWELSPPVSYGVLRRLAKDLEHHLRSIPGTKQTKRFGDPAEEILVEVDAYRLARLGLTPEEVTRKIVQSDAKVPAGRLRGFRNDLLIEVEGELDSLDRVNQLLILHGAQGQAVRLGDISTVRKTSADPPSDLAILDGKPAVAVAARMEPGYRVDLWSRQARETLGEFRERVPRGIGLQVVFDQSRYVESRLNTLQVNLLFGALLVVIVILFMMGWRSALLVGSVLPLSSLMVLAGMKLLGVPLHQMSVTGLIIALGLLIDNAIIMVDDVSARLRGRMAPARAVAQSVRHLAIPLLGSTATTVLAFMPLVLMPGGAGEFVGSIGISVSLALFSSLFVALTIVPALTGWINRRKAASLRPAWWRTGLSHPALTGLYRRTLDGVFSRPLLGVLIALVLPVVGFVQGSKLEEQFFPPADRDQLQIELRLPSQASLAQTQAYALRARELILGHPEVTNVHWFVGGSAPKFYYNMMTGQDDSAFYAQGVVNLSSHQESQRLTDLLQEELDEVLPAAQVIVRQFEQGPPFEAPVELHISGPDLERLRELGEAVRAQLAQISDVIHTRATLTDGQPKLWFRIDEEGARLAGLDNVGVARQLNHVLEGTVGGSLIEASEELPVRVRLSNAHRGDLKEIASLDLLPADFRPGAGAEPSLIPIQAVGQLRLLPDLATIPRRKGVRTNTVQGFIRPGVLPAKVLGEFKKGLEASRLELPPGYKMEVGGESEERDTAVGNLMASAGVLLVLMAGTLVLSFNSFRAAGIIASVGGLSVGLALLSLWLFGYPFGFMAIVGTMGLVGVAVNDSIVVLAAIRENSRARQGDPKEVREVVVRSTRHVLSTSVTTMAGFTPLLLAGSGFWTPLAISIAGGITGATLLGLYFAPSAYLLMIRRGRRVDKRTAPDMPVST
ncbi:MAG: efflux RND transporter permease subunit [Nitrospinota bacterium]